MSFDAMIRHWLPLTCALDAVNRSMGRDDLYPFTVVDTVVAKLRFVHDAVEARARRDRQHARGRAGWFRRGRR